MAAQSKASTIDLSPEALAQSTTGPPPFDWKPMLKSRKPTRAQRLHIPILYFLIVGLLCLFARAVAKYEDRLMTLQYHADDITVKYWKQRMDIFDANVHQLLEKIPVGLQPVIVPEGAGGASD